MTKYTSHTVTTTKYVPQNAKTTVKYNDTTTTYTRQIDISDYVFFGVLILVVIIGIIGFIKSVRSRKYYRCPVCGESFRSENMNSQTCKVCGANLEETDDPNINDKTK